MGGLHYEIKINAFVKNKIAFSLALMVFIMSSIVLIRWWVVDPWQNDNTMDGLQQMIYSKDLKPETINSREFREKRLSEATGANSNIKGWIKVEGTPIDYPVLQNRSDPEYYLYRNYMDEDSRFGSIFVDASCDLERGCKNILLHGHSMNNGSMFRSLLEFTELQRYRDTPIFAYDMPGKIADWKIISIFRTNTLPEHGELFDYLRADFSSDSDFLNYVYQVKVRSLLNIPVDVNENDELITLSTCSYEMKGFRTVVVARKVRDGETTDVNVSKANWANNPVLPEAYYSVFGTPKPNNITNFNDALKNDRVPWYSGTKTK